MPCAPHRGAVRRWPSAALIGLLLAVAACGGNGGGGDFAACGNGSVNDGEQCDDGNLIDTDACTSICRTARCGDGAIQSGVEDCEGLILPANCQALGHANDGNRTLPGCSADCRFDLSLCGPAFTPTALASASATASATPSATDTPTALPSGVASETPTTTPTATPLPCGNGLLEPGETCESCAADCEARACSEGDEQFTFDVTFAAPLGEQPTTVTVLVAYRSDVISLPGSAGDASIRRRLRIPPPLPATLGVNDLEYALRVVLGRNEPLPATLFGVQFDACGGAPAPSLADLSCRVEGCAVNGVPLDGCGCAIGEAAP